MAALTGPHLSPQHKKEKTMTSIKDALAEENFSAEEIIKLAIARRGDIFPEQRIFIEADPKAYSINQRAVGYAHQYDSLGTPDQVLSLPMRELIATCMLAAKGDDRFAPNHVRRMWRIGVTNKVMFEAALAMVPATGWSTIPHVALAVITAGDPNYTDGAIPEGGEPKTLKPFVELTQGRTTVQGFDKVNDAGLLADPDWADIAKIDPEFARRAARLLDYALLVGGPTDKDLLGPGPRELVCIAGLCGKGYVDFAARHIRRAYAWGMTQRQVLEAICCLLPMGGPPSLQLGMQAIRKAEAA